MSAAVRPPVSVIVPFAGGDRDLERLLASLAVLHLEANDEVIVAHNRLAESDDLRHGRILIHGAAGVRSPGYARNCGAALAQGEWLVFLDADTEPDYGLIDKLFEPAPAERTAVLAGAIEDAPAGKRTVARHARARRHMSQQITLRAPGLSYAQTANCAVRRRAFDAVGGFNAGARAGEDADLCLRLQQQGWQLESRPHARVRHLSRETLSGWLGQLAVHGAGAAWLSRRHPDAMAFPGPAALMRRMGHHARFGIRLLAEGRREDAAFEALDLLGALAFAAGRLLPNRPRREHT